MRWGLSFKTQQDRPHHNYLEDVTKGTAVSRAVCVPYAEVQSGTFAVTPDEEIYVIPPSKTAARGRHRASSPLRDPA